MRLKFTNLKLFILVPLAKNIQQMTLLSILKEKYLNLCIT